MSVLLVVGALGNSSPSMSHDWYPWECCSDNDCAPIPVAETPREEGGGFTLTDGRRVNYRDLKPSPDGLWHLCEQKWPTNTRKRKILCLYGPIGGS
jgi:hypothetical protein